MSGPIYTRRGDAGETSLADGSRVHKNSARVEAYGTVDEANSAIGLARAALSHAVAVHPVLAELDWTLTFVQNRLFDCASNLATPADAASDRTPRVTADDTAALERVIDEMTAAMGEIDHFVLPAGCEPAARLHVARTVIRRAERRILDLADAEPVDSDVLAFVNRLSDLLFTAARYVNHTCGAGDVFWEPRGR